MNLADIVKRAPKYMDVVAAYDLDVKGGDLQLTPNADLALRPTFSSSCMIFDFWAHHRGGSLEVL
jgi:hypothetical protein